MTGRPSVLPCLDLAVRRRGEERPARPARAAVAASCQHTDCIVAWTGDWSDSHYVVVLLRSNFNECRYSPALPSLVTGCTLYSLTLRKDQNDLTAD